MNDKAKSHPILKIMATHLMERNSDEWPPKCAVFTYQPRRPIQQAPKKNS